MQTFLQGTCARWVKKVTTEFYGLEFSRQMVSNLTERLDEQVRA